jgi:hypothetical protein
MNLNLDKLVDFMVELTRGGPQELECAAEVLRILVKNEIVRENLGPGFVIKRAIDTAAEAELGIARERYVKLTG